MGVYQVKNRINGKMLIGSAMDLPGAFNRLKFELSLGSCRNRALQKEWREFGPDAFEFSILEELKPLEEPDYHPYEDLQILESMWRDKLNPFVPGGYTPAKKREN